MYRDGEIELKQIEAFRKRWCHIMSHYVTFISLMKEQRQIGPGWQCILRTWRSVLQRTSGSNLCDISYDNIYINIRCIYIYIILCNLTEWIQRCGHRNHAWDTSSIGWPLRNHWDHAPHGSLWSLKSSWAEVSSVKAWRSILPTRISHCTITVGTCRYYSRWILT